MKLNICMLVFLHYQPNMRVYAWIENRGYLRYFGHSVTWIIWGKESRHIEPFSFEGIRVYTTPEVQYFPGTSQLAKIINMIPNTLRRMRIASKILTKGKYDLIVVGDFAFDGLVAAYIKRRYKIPFVFELSNPVDQVWEEYKLDTTKPIFLYYLAAKFHQFIATKLLHEADLILSASKWLKEHLVEQGIPESKIVTTPSGIDISLFSNQDGAKVRKKYRLEDSAVIIYVGELMKPRYLHVLIQAFSKVEEKRKNVKLLMVGEGSDERNLRRLATELNIQDDVIFTGRVPHSEVPDFIAAADIAVSPVSPLPFFKLSSPIKQLEYMAMAKPVVATEEIPEQEEILKESGAGILASFTPEAIADAIIELLDDPERATEMGRRGREWVVKNRSYDKLAKELEQAYYKILRGGT